MRQNEKGFALILSLVLLVVMSLMGGSLIIIASGDHKNNNTNDKYQQTFYVAETALLEGERYLLNQLKGPWTEGGSRSTGNLPANIAVPWKGEMNNSTWITPVQQSMHHLNINPTDALCYNSFRDIEKDKDIEFQIVTAVSYNFGILLSDGLKKLFTGTKKITKPEHEENRLKDYHYEYFITRIGSAPFRGYGSSVMTGITGGSSSSGMAYRVYACGIYKKSGRMIIPLESVVVLPAQ